MKRLPAKPGRVFGVRLLPRLLPLVVLVVVAGCGKSVAPPPSPPKPIPAKPGAVAPPAGEAPSCTPAEQREVQAGHGELGSCAPKKAEVVATTAFASLTSSGATGPDVSNNDPLYNWQAVRAHGHPFGYLKTIQGTAFVDATAAGMARAARAAGVVPGGYDFLEVCRVSSAGEARLFAARLKAIGLVGHAFVPVGDAEWPLRAPCSAQEARGWLTSWSSTVHSLTGRWPAFYTGAWWWNPNVGCWRPAHALRWVSGYTSRQALTVPCGWGGVDLWQYTSAGFNGVSVSDMSRLEVPGGAFTGSAAPTHAQTVARWHRELDAHYVLRARLHGDIDNRHCRPGPPWFGHARPPKYHSLCVRWLAHGGQEVAIIEAFHKKGVY